MMGDSLPSVSPPITIFEGHTAETTTTLLVKEKTFSWSGDDFGIKDSNGDVLARCRGKAWSIRSRKVITDSEGIPIYYIQEGLFRWNRRFIASDESGHRVFKLVHRRFSFRAKQEITLAQSIELPQSIQLNLRGGFWGMSADVMLGQQGAGRSIAQIVRNPWSAKDIWTNKQTYHVKVAPGVDMMLLAGIAICFDETMNDKRRTTTIWSLFSLVTSIISLVYIVKATSSSSYSQYS